MYRYPADMLNKERLYKVDNYRPIIAHFILEYTSCRVNEIAEVDRLFWLAICTSLIGSHWYDISN